MCCPSASASSGQHPGELDHQVERKRANRPGPPTENIRRRYAAQGKTLPAVWPAGQTTPWACALCIGNLYAIHGTNATFGIGLRVSSGCVRLRADDIKYLFDHVPVAPASSSSPAGQNHGRAGWRSPTCTSRCRARGRVPPPPSRPLPMTPATDRPR